MEETQFVDKNFYNQLKKTAEDMVNPDKEKTLEELRATYGKQKTQTTDVERIKKLKEFSNFERLDLQECIDLYLDQYHGEYIEPSGHANISEPLKNFIDKVLQKYIVHTYGSAATGLSLIRNIAHGDERQINSAIASINGVKKELLRPEIDHKVLSQKEYYSKQIKIDANHYIIAKIIEYGRHKYLERIFPNTLTDDLVVDNQRMDINASLYEALANETHALLRSKDRQIEENYNYDKQDSSGYETSGKLTNLNRRYKFDSTRIKDADIITLKDDDGFSK